MNHEIDHALTTISCTLDGMEAVLQMMMEVESANKEAIGYLMIGCISDIRKHCVVIGTETNAGPTNREIQST